MTHRLHSIAVLVLVLVGLATGLRANITAADFAGTWFLEQTDPFNQPLFSEVGVVVGSDGAITIQTVGIPTRVLAQASLVGDALKFDVPRTSPYYGDFVVSYSLGLNGDVSQTSPVFAPQSGSQTLTFNGVHQQAPSIVQQPYFSGTGGTYTTNEVQSGSSVTIVLVASSDTPAAYQWRRDGNDVSGATSASLAMTSTTSADSGTYTCLIRNAAGGVLTKGAMLTVWNPIPSSGPGSNPPSGSGTIPLAPITILPPPSSVVKDPATGILIIQFGSGPPVVSVSTHTSDVPVTGTFLDSATTPLATGTANTLTVVPGTYVGFNAYATGWQPKQVQWTKNGAALPGVTGSSFAIAAASDSDAGTYGCSVSNWAGSSSWAVSLTTAKKPVIVNQTLNSTATLGQALHLSVHATSESAPLSFQWYHDGNAIAGATNGSFAGSASPVDASSNFDVSSLASSDAGNYWCAIKNSAGSVTTQSVLAAFAPTITQQPVGSSISPGKPLVLSVSATCVGYPVNFQWYLDGVLIPGATDGTINVPVVLSSTPVAATVRNVISTFAVNSAQSGDAGKYTCVAANVAGATTSLAAEVMILRPARIINLSTRLQAGGVAGNPICGFVVQGSAPLGVILRAVGPTLASFGLNSTLPNPFIALHTASGDQTNDNWDAALTDRMAAVGAFPLNSQSNDAVLPATLAPAQYTADAYDRSGAQGIVLFEIYDAAQDSSASRLINASTRGYVGTGDQAMFPGFVISGTGTVTILIRAVGPTLRDYGVTDAISDPLIQLYRDGTEIASNDNWSDGTNAASIETTMSAAGAFSLARGTKDAVIVTSLGSGTYSARITGVNGVTGTALMELYLVQ